MHTEDSGQGGADVGDMRADRERQRQPSFTSLDRSQVASDERSAAGGRKCGRNAGGQNLRKSAIGDAVGLGFGQPAAARVQESECSIFVPHTSRKEFAPYDILNSNSL